MHRKRRVVVVILSLLLFGFVVAINSEEPIDTSLSTSGAEVLSESYSERATEALETIAIKGRAPKTDYSREQFGNGWGKINGCDTRNIILNRDLRDVRLNEETCHILEGILDDPYTGKMIYFNRGSNSEVVQIDHVVALSDAWQKGATQLNKPERVAFANDPLNLLAVEGAANQQKGDADAASWLPPNKNFRCQYVARQIAVKSRYSLWMTPAEHEAISSVLQKCPEQLLPSK